MLEMNTRLIDGMLDEILPHFKAMKDRCDRLEARVAELEAGKPEKGERGEKGEPGIDGKDIDEDTVVLRVHDLMVVPKDGAPGKDGKDADPEAVRDMVDDAVSKRFDALPRLPVSSLIDEKGNLVNLFANGEKQEVGRVRGASVMDGKVDDRGVLILRMSDGREIQTGIVRGKDGEGGRQGDAGRPGRDAVEIQIMPGIDESKTYPEGVFARYRGGLIRAERATSPIEDGDIKAAGWGTILNGIAEQAEETIDGGRFTEKLTVYTDGSVVRHRIKSQALIYRGLWTAGNYLQGDQVTWAGGMWVAMQDTDEAPGTKKDDTSHWRLSVKKGRDGKDLTEPKPRGPVIVPGAASK